MRIGIRGVRFEDILVELLGLAELARPMVLQSQ